MSDMNINVKENSDKEDIFQINNFNETINYKNFENIDKKVDEFYTKSEIFDDEIIESNIEKSNESNENNNEKNNESNVNNNENNKIIQKEINSFSDNPELNNENLVTEKIGQCDEMGIFNEAEKVNKSNFNNKDMINLVEEFNNLKLYDPKIDVIFNRVFGKPNEENARNLMNAIFFYEKATDKVSFKDTRIFPHPVNINKRTATVDLHFKNNANNKCYLTEMKVHEKYNLNIRRELSMYKIISRIIESSNTFEIGEKIISVNLIYYNMFDDNKFYHKLTALEINDTSFDDNINKIFENGEKMTKNVNNKKNKSSSLQLLKNEYNHEKETIIIELKKFRKKLNDDAIKHLVAFSDKIENIKKEIEEEEKKPNKTRKEINDTNEKKEKVKEDERLLKFYLWLAFLSKINTVYEKNPNYSDEEKLNGYGKKIKNRKDTIKIRTEFSFELYKLFKRYDEIMKALELCKAPLDEENKRELEEKDKKN